MFLGAILTASFLPTSGILARELNFVSCEALPRQTYFYSILAPFFKNPQDILQLLQNMEQGWEG